MNAFEVLGLNMGADTEAVKQAYRTRVKLCHPDQFVDEKQQQKAQQELIELNLAYEQALKMSSQNQVGYHEVSAPQAKKFAQKLYDQGNYPSALRQLARAETKDAEYFYLEGKILLALKEFGSAHQAFREACKLEPDNAEYHRGALDAALQYKKHNRLPYRVIDWASGVIHPRRK